MSRIGKLPVPVPEGCEVKIEGNRVVAKGAKGEMEINFHKDMIIEMQDSSIIVKRPSETKNHKALHGLTRSLIANMIEGVTKGFERKMELRGVGYRVELVGSDLQISVGYSKPVLVKNPEGIVFTTAGNTRFSVIGIDKQKVGQVASDIRKIRKPEPYKGKGIFYEGEQIKRKAGKTVG